MDHHLKATRRMLTKDQVQLSKLAAPEDLKQISQVKFAHDPVPNLPSYIEASNIPFPRGDIEAGHPFQNNGLRLRPQAARLPYRSTFDTANESRYWTQGLEASKKLLQLLAGDHSTSDIVVGRGITMGKLAQRELRPEFEHRFCKATSYMYPLANEERTRLLAASMVMMFLFDDKGEETSASTVKPFVEDFVHRINNFREHSASDSHLQQHIDSVMRGFRNADFTAGNAGKEVIEAMSESFRRMRPKQEFKTLRQYLEFRHDNVGANYVLAAVKFSICSEVDMSDARLIKYLNLVKDHLAIVNDMASYDKEKRNFDEGSSRDLINIIDIVQRIMSLPDTDSAKVMSYAYQLQTERWMSEELERLKEHEDLDIDQWRYLKATYDCAAGNVFFSMTSSRYGGEPARLHILRDCNGTAPLTRKRSLSIEVGEEQPKRERHSGKAH